MKRRNANAEILGMLADYITENPDQRFGQILRNTGVVVDYQEVDVADNGTTLTKWTNHFNEEPDVTLKRMIETETKRKG